MILYFSYAIHAAMDTRLHSMVNARAYIHPMPLGDLFEISCQRSSDFNNSHNVPFCSPDYSSPIRQRLARMLE